MKNTKSKLMMSALIIAGFISLSTEANSQDRKLPDGTIIYSDGTRRLPNGTVIYKDGGAARQGSTINLPDGSVIYPEGERRYPNSENRKVYRTKNGKGLPPGQAKKIYGGSARDYAPGQVKKQGNGNGNWKTNKASKGKGHKGK